MKRTGLFVLGSLGVSMFVLASSPVFADDSNPATLNEIHQLLLEAAGFNAAVPPTVAQQTDLLDKTLERIRHVPHVYHGQLVRASRDIEAALDELSTGNNAHKAREDIFDADDQIKAIM